jgi:hypothetical protein
LDPIDLLKRIQLAFVAAWTGFGRLPPLAWAFQIGRPERPRPALLGPDFVDAATACLRVEENAVAIGVFDQTSASSDVPNEFSFKTVQIVLHADLLCDRFDFLLVDPNKSGLGPRAAIATSGALEGQAGSIPRKRWSMFRILTA